MEDLYDIRMDDPSYHVLILSAKSQCHRRFDYCSALLAQHSFHVTEDLVYIRW